jgi:NodT family efflux transporter outer membrane factor (OMF) lipoprotein
LVGKALAGSPTLGLTQARLARAQALAAGASANTGVQVNAGLDATTQRYSANSIYPAPLGGSTKTMANAQISAGWEIDFFGRNRAAIAAAVGVQRAAEAELQAARVLLASLVVRAYVQVGHLTALRDVAQRSLAQRGQLRVLIDQRVQAGLDTAVEARQGEAALPEARLQIEQIDEQLMLARHALSTLTAQRPDALDTLTVDGPELRRMPLPTALDADLLGRRADITAARWRVEASGSDIAAARAQFYPNVNLNAFVGLSSIGLGRLLDTGSAQIGVGPAIRLPIFDSGRLRANLGVKTADHDIAVEQYNAVVRDAVRDAVEHLASLQSLARQQREQADTHAGAQAAYDLVSQRYGAGLATYLAVLNAEGQLLAQQRLAADLAARVLETQVALVGALGGGYDGYGSFAGDDPARRHAASAPVVASSPTSN